MLHPRPESACIVLVNWMRFTGCQLSMQAPLTICSLYIPCRWRQLLDALPLPIVEVTIRRSWAFRHLETAPLQISQLSLELNPEEMPLRYAPLLDSLLSSTAVRRHSGPSLHCIHALGPFTLSEANAAAYPHLTRLERLAVDGVTAACLPSGLKCLTFEGRGWDDDTLEASALSHLTRLETLDLFYLSVDFARLPHRVFCSDLIGCEPGAEFATALKASPEVLDESKCDMWRDDSQWPFGRELLYGYVCPAWDRDGRLVIQWGDPLRSCNEYLEYGEPCLDGEQFHICEDDERSGPGWSLV